MASYEGKYDVQAHHDKEKCTLDKHNHSLKTKPTHLDDHADRAITTAFIHNPNDFTGRAISQPTTHIEEPRGNLSCEVSRRLNNSALSTDADSDTSSTSTVRFIQDNSVSLISRALSSTIPHDLCILAKTTTNAKQVSATDTLKPVRPCAKPLGINRLNEHSYMKPGIEESPRMSKFSMVTSLLPWDEHSTILEIRGVQYIIPHSELWLLPHSKSQNLHVEDLAHLIRPTFYKDIDRLGPRKAIQGVHGKEIKNTNKNRLPVRQSSSSESPRRATDDKRSRCSNHTTQVGKSTLNLADGLDTFTTRGTVVEIGRKNSDYEASESPTSPKNIEMDGAHERRPLLSPIHLTSSGSVRSGKTVGTPRSDPEIELDINKLELFVTTVRAALPTQSINDEDVEQLKEILEVFLDNETYEMDEGIALTLITRIRFDKLLTDLLNLKTNDPELMGLAATATSLQRIWRDRFNGEYMFIDEERLKTMLTCGALRGLSLKVGDDETKLPVWQVEKGYSIVEGSLKPGHFWLNIECAYRDGVVESTVEKLTLSRYGNTPTLPLLTGTELWDRSQPGRTRYRRQCRPNEIPYKLMCRGDEFKGKIRILRGHELVSKFAPKGGVRYDGEYMVTHFAHLPTPDFNLDIRHFELVIERIPGQRGFHDVPSPVQLDEWHLYQRYIDSYRRRVMKAQTNLLRKEADTKDGIGQEVEKKSTEEELEHVFGDFVIQ